MSSHIPQEEFLLGLRMDQKNLEHRVFSLIVHTVDKLFGENSLQPINDSWTENVKTQLDQRCIELIDFHRVCRTSSGNVFPLKLLCWISSWPKDSRAWKLDLRSFNSAWNVRKLCNWPWISQFPRSFHAYCGTARCWRAQLSFRFTIYANAIRSTVFAEILDILHRFSNTIVYKVSGWFYFLRRKARKWNLHGNLFRLLKITSVSLSLLYICRRWKDTEAFPLEFFGKPPIFQSL